MYFGESTLYAQSVAETAIGLHTNKHRQFELTGYRMLTSRMISGCFMLHMEMFVREHLWSK